MRSRDLLLKFWLHISGTK